MKKEMRTAVYDDELRMDAFRFKGIAQPFPNHFHEHYVIGVVEEGKRRLTCKNNTYSIEKGSVLLLNPGDNHACVQSGDGTFDYRGLNISKGVMLDLVEEASGKRELPGFSKNVICDGKITCYLRAFHEMVMNGASDFRKEESLLLLLSALIQNYSHPFESCVPECRREIERACEFLEQSYGERIDLAQICRYAGLSKSTLLRAFTRSKGVTPHQYLQAIRISKAKELLKKGIRPIEAAMLTGFADQSHFTNHFSRFIGLTPGVYREIFLPENKAEREDKNGLAK